MKFINNDIVVCFRFGRKKGVIVPMLLAAAGAAGSVLLTTDDESKKGNVFPGWNKIVQKAS